MTDEREIATAVESENAGRVKRVLDLGLPPLVLDIIAVKARINAIFDVMPNDVKAAVDIAYEMELAGILDHVASDIEAEQAKARAQTLLL